MHPLYYFLPNRIQWNNWHTRAPVHCRSTHASLSVCWHQFGFPTPDTDLCDHVNDLTSGRKASVSCIQDHKVASQENSSSNVCNMIWPRPSTELYIIYTVWVRHVMLHSWKHRALTMSYKTQQIYNRIGHDHYQNAELSIRILPIKYEPASTCKYKMYTRSNVSWCLTSCRIKNLLSCYNIWDLVTQPYSTWMMQWKMLSWTGYIFLCHQHQCLAMAITKLSKCRETISWKRVTVWRFGMYKFCKKKKEKRKN